jgi:flagellar biosynthesis protein FlhG
VPTDPAVREAVQRRQLLLEAIPGCPAATAVTGIAEKLVG